MKRLATLILLAGCLAAVGWLCLHPGRVSRPDEDAGDRRFAASSAALVAGTAGRPVAHADCEDLTPFVNRAPGVPVDTLLGGQAAAVLSRLELDSPQTAAAFARFLQRGNMAELRQVSRESVDSFARHLVRETSVDALARLMEETLRLPPDYVVNRKDPAGLVGEVFDAVSDKGSSPPAQSTLIVTDACAPDGRVTGETHVIPAGSRRVYGVFENGGSLGGLQHIVAVWRNPEQDRMVFAETEPVHAGSRYNYVWLELDGGWPVGRYRLDLFDPSHPSLRLASERFRVQ
ncbi:MAG: hypothetical protein MUE94_12595 [Verrucomicrobia bacterium]|nr:hypothetical protein [Verrucomicrobiota bacterium]